MVALLRSQLAWEQSCAMLRKKLPDWLGMQVEIGRCELDPLTQTVTLHGLRAARPQDSAPVFSADQAQISLGSVFFSYVRLNRVTLLRPRVNLDLSKATGAPEGPRSSGCALDALDRVRIDQLELRDGEISVARPGGERGLLTGLQIGWQLRGGALDVELSASGGALSTASGRELVLSRLLAQGQLDLDEKNIELTRAELGLDEASLNLSGAIKQLCSPNLALQGRVLLPLSVVRRAGLVEQPLEGQLWAKATISGALDSMTAQAELVGSGVSIGAYAPGDFSAQLSYSGGQLTLHELMTEAGKGSLRLHGSMELSKKLPVRVWLESKDAQFGRVLEKTALPHSWVDFGATAKAQLSGNLLPALQLQGDVDVLASGLIVAARPFDAPVSEGRTLLEVRQAKLNSRVAILGDRTEFSELRIESSDSSLHGDVTLYYSLEKGMRARGVAQLDFGQLGHIAQISWSGRGEASFELDGAYDDPRIDAQLAFRDFSMWDLALGVVQGRLHYEDRKLSFPGVSGQKGRTQYFGTGELRFVPGDLYSVARVSFPSAQTEDLVDLIVGLHPSIDIFQKDLTGQASGSFELEGLSDHFGGAILLDFKNTAYYGRRLGDGKVSLRFVDGSALVLEPSALEGPVGKLSMQGSWAFAGPLDYRFRLSGGSLAELVGPERAAQLGVSGALSAVAEVEGDSTTPVVNAYLSSPRVTFANKSLGSAHLELRSLGRDAQVWGTPFEDARLTMKMRMKSPVPYEANVTLALPEIRPLLPDGAISQGLSGSVSGTAQFAGNLKEPSQSSAKVRLDGLRLSRGDFEAANRGPIAFSWEAGRLQLSSLRLSGPNTELAAEGSWGPSTTELSAHGRLDVRLLESFLPELEQTGGRVELSVAATGPVRSPSLVGSADLKDVRLSLKGAPVSVRSLSGRVEFSEARVLIEDALGVLNDGKLRLRGDVRLAGTSIERVEMGFDFGDVSVRPYDYLPMTLHGGLWLRGKPGAFSLSGAVEVSKLRYEQSITLESLLRQAQAARVGPAEKKTQWLRYDVDVDLGKDVRIDNDLARATLAGRLKLTGTNVRPGLLGLVDVEEGGQAFWRGNEFSIAKGELQFKDASSIDSTVDLNAQTQVRDYAVTLKAFGPLSDPKIVLTSEPTLSEADILTLLTLGVTSRDRGFAERAGGVAAEALLSATGLGSRVASFLPKGGVLRDFDVHLSTSYNEASNQVEPAWSVESKLLREQLKLSMTQPVSGKGSRFQAEYRFNDRLSGRVQWDNESQDFSLGNPGLDLKLRFEWE